MTAVRLVLVTFKELHNWTLIVCSRCRVFGDLVKPFIPLERPTTRFCLQFNTRVKWPQLKLQRWKIIGRDPRRASAWRTSSAGLFDGKCAIGCRQRHAGARFCQVDFRRLKITRSCSWTTLLPSGHAEIRIGKTSLAGGARGGVKRDLKTGVASLKNAARR